MIDSITMKSATTKATPDDNESPEVGAHIATTQDTLAPIPDTMPRNFPKNCIAFLMPLIRNSELANNINHCRTSKVTPGYPALAIYEFIE
jgi:hypothetical protein